MAANPTGADVRTMRAALTVPLTMLAVQVLLIAGLAVTAGLDDSGLGPAGWAVGLASAGVPNQLIYNTIYEERFMGVLPENRDAYIKCSRCSRATNRS